MTTKEYLGQVHEIDIKIKEKQEQLEAMQERATSISSTNQFGVKVKSSSNHDNIGMIAAKIADTESEIQSLMVKKALKKHEIIEKIQGVENVLYSSILFWRYIELEKYSDIAKEVERTEIHIIKSHGLALKAFEEKYSDFLQNKT